MRQPHLSLAMASVVVCLGGFALISLAEAGSAQHSPADGSPRPAPLSARLKDADLEQAAYDRTAAKVNADPQQEQRLFAALNTSQKMVLATYGCEAEVNNGGFHQYFWNSEGRHAQAALDGYRLIGASRHAALVKRAIATARAEEARMNRLRAGAGKDDFDKRFAESEEHSALNALDDPFYKAEAAEPVTALRASYIRKHIRDF